MSRTLVIGEMGSTHEGNLDLMLRLIDVAADCGVDCVKNQWVSSPERLCERRRAGDYLASYTKLAYPLGAHIVCRDHANARGLKYATSIYLPGDAALVAPFVDYLKISSFEAGDKALIHEALSAVGPFRVVVSHGMGGDVWSAACQNLLCVSSYPAPIDAASLGRITNEDFDGFSDHSRDVRVGAWAVCAGAEILETHFRLDDCDPENKDYAVSFTPAEFKEYIANIRAAELALGDGQKRIAECEKPMLRFRANG